MNDARNEFRQSLAIIRWENECREAVAAGLRRGEILPPTDDRKAYVAIVQAGVRSGLI